MFIVELNDFQAGCCDAIKTLENLSYRLLGVGGKSDDERCASVVGARQFRVAVVRLRDPSGNGES
jgi:hypothetical protein